MFVGSYELYGDVNGVGVAIGMAYNALRSVLASIQQGHGVMVHGPHDLELVDRLVLVLVLIAPQRDVGLIDLAQVLWQDPPPMPTHGRIAQGRLLHQGPKLTQGRRGAILDAPKDNVQVRTSQGSIQGILVDGREELVALGEPQVVLEELLFPAL